MNQSYEASFLDGMDARHGPPDLSDPAWTLRTLQPHDLEPVVALCREAFPLEYAQSWFHEVCSGRFISFGLFHDERIVALLVAEMKTVDACDMEDRDISSQPHSTVIYVMSLAVSKGYRRLGIATILLEHLLRTKTYGHPYADIVFLHVLAKNGAAIKFYLKHGFRHHKTLTNYYLIDGAYHDGLTFVLYLNSHSTPCSFKQMCSTMRSLLFLPFRALVRSNWLRSKE